MLRGQLSDKSKASRLYASNVRVVAYYGAEKHGLGETELACAWRLATKLLSPSTLGSSVGAMALTNLDVTGPLLFTQARR